MFQSKDPGLNLINKSKAALIENQQAEEEIMLLLEQVLAALDKMEIALPAIKVAEAIDALRSL